MQIIPFQPDHLARLEVQPDQAEAVGAMSQQGYGQFLADAGPAFTGVDGDRIVICAGLVPLWPGRSSLWALLSVHAAKFMLAIHRATLRFLATRTDRRIEATCATGFKEAHRWLEMLGFTREGTLRGFTPEGFDHDMYSRVR